MWGGQGGWADGVLRYVGSSYNGVFKIENGQRVLGRQKWSNGDIDYEVDDNDNSTFNQEAEDFADKVNACKVATSEMDQVYGLDEYGEDEIEENDFMLEKA